MTLDLKPGISYSAPPHPWQDISLEQWTDWRWQMSNRLNTVKDFGEFINLTESEKEALSAQHIFRVDITPYFASLIDPDDPDCPVRLQVIPRAEELVPDSFSMVDSLAEDQHSPVPGLVHRYPDRVLLMTTTQCASYCRFCTRSRIVGDSSANFGTSDFQKQVEYIASHPQVRDVLLSGGDPLVFSDKMLENVFKALSEIPHVEIIRINTRVPVFLPQRVTGDLVNMLSQYQPVWMNLNINHPKEITPELEEAIAKLANAGVVLGSQSVLMAGINDCPNIFLDLVHKLVKNRVRPYYLYQCDQVQGAGHFRTPVAKGIEIIEALRGHTSGYAIPTFVVDMPEGGGKAPVQPNYLISMSDEKVVLRNFEGFISAYVQPTDYKPHDPDNCASCQAHRGKIGQRGISGLLEGKKRSIKPDNWVDNHHRD
jgi:lysine 2,3-aminomutase